MQGSIGIKAHSGPENALHTLLSKHVPILDLIPKLQATGLQTMTVFTYLGMIIYFVQLIGFVINPHYPWGVIISTGLDQAIFSTHIPAYDGYFSAHTNSTGLQVVIWVTVGLLFAAMLPVLYRRDAGAHVNDAAPSVDASKTLTTIETLVTLVVGSLFRSTSTWLVVPMAHWACAAWTCKDGTLPATVGYLDEAPSSCYSGTHIAAIIGAILMLLLALPVLVAFTSIDAVTNPLSVHPRARAHTMVDTFAVIQLFVLTGLFHVGDAFGALQVPAAALAVTSALMAGVIAYMIPFYNHLTNRVYCSMHTAAAVVGFVGFFATQFNTPGSVTGRSPTTLLISSFPLALVFGWCLPDSRIATRWQQLLVACDQGLDCIDDDHDAEVRLMPDYDKHEQSLPTMHVAGLDDFTPWQLTDDELEIARHDNAFDAKKKELDLFFEDDDRVSHDSSTSSSNASHGGARADGTDPDLARKRRMEINQLVSRTSAVIKPCMASPYVTTAAIPTDVELATRFVTSYRRKFCLPAPENLRDACASIFNRGLFKFSTSAIVPIHFAQYVAKSDTPRCSSALQVLERVPNLDPSIFDIVRCSELRQELRAALGILDHTYEHHMARAAELHTEALRRMHAFWLKLMEPSVDLASAADVADELHAVRRKALDRFRSALEAQRGGLDIDFAKKLGLFMSEVMLDNGAATECEAVATELAKRVSKRRNAVDAEMATRVSRLSVVIGGDDEAINANTGAERARRTSLLQHMSFVFAALIMCVAALLGISVLTSSVDHVLTDRVVHANKLRTLPFQALYTLLEYQQELSSHGGVTVNSAAYSTRLLTIVSDLETSLRNVVEDTAGATSYVANLNRGRLSSETEVSTGPTGRILSTSFWLTATMTIDELRRVATAANGTTLSTVSTTLSHLQSHVTSTTAETVSRQLVLWVQEHANAQEVSTAIAILIVLCGILITLIAVAALLHNFRVAAETKFLTFQLFTLIPFDSLELLATATKNKVDDREALGKTTALVRGAVGEDDGNNKDAEATVEDEDDEDLFDTAAPPTDLPSENGAPPRSPAVGSDTDSRRPSGDDAKRRQSSSSKRSRDPRSWRGMLANAVRNNVPKGVLKPTVFGVEPSQATKKPPGPRVMLNPEVDIVAPPPSDDTDDKAALMSGKAAANMLLALTKSTTASPTPEASASSISLAEKTGELDLEAIKAGEQWRVTNNVYPTKVVGGRTRRLHRRTKEVEPDVKTTARASADFFFRFFAQWGTIGATVAFIIAFPTIIASDQGPERLVRLDGAIDAVARQYLDQSTLAASYVFSPTPVAQTRDRFLSYRSFCGVPLLAEPLFNCTTTTLEADAVVSYVDALTKLTSAQSDAVLLADYAYASLGTITSPASYTLGSLQNATAILAKRASLHQAVADAYTLSLVATQSGTTTPSTDLALLILEASRRILSSPAVVQLGVQARAALRDASKLFLSTTCSDVLETVNARVTLAVARWVVLAALICKVVSLAFAEGHGFTWGTFRHAVGITFISINVGMYAAVAVANDDVADALSRSCTAVDAASELSMLEINAVRSTQQFTATGDRSSWAAFRTLTPERLTAGMLDTVANLVPHIPAYSAERMEDLLVSLRQPTVKLQYLHSVSVTLSWIARQTPLTTYSSSTLGLAYTDPTLLPDATTNGFLSVTTWNVLDDPTTVFDVSAFYGGNPLLTITNRSFDLPRWSPVQSQAAAVALVHDTRYLYYLRQMEDATLNLKAEVRHAWEDYATSMMGHRYTLTLVAFIIGVVSSTVIASWHFPALLRQMWGDLLDEFWSSNDEKNSSAMERIRSSPAFRTALQKSYVAVSVIMMLLLAALGVAIYEARANDLIPQYLEAGGLRGLLVAQSLTDLLRGSDANTDGNACALRATEALVREGNDMWVNYGSNTWGAVGLDSTLETLNWGPSSNGPYESDAANFGTSQCGVASQPSSTQPYGPFGELSTMPLQIALRYWRALVYQYTTAPSSNLLSTLQTLAEQIVKTSLTSDTTLADAANSRVNTAAIALQVICAATIAVVLFLHQWLVIPLSRQLISVQQDTLLMLQVVPPDVRDLVPAITEYMETGTMDTAAEIRRKLEMNESLLKNILPENISRRLKSGESPIADMHPSITIVFTDFVGFTSISSGLSAEEIVDFLNEVFVEFDLISEMLKLDKIKTIGDAYFMTGGLDPTITDHAMRVIEASIFMFEALAEHNAKHRDRKPLRMRLGVHTGPAIAGVIGTKKVAYDLWGPNVGIANGMEASGIPGRIHVSDATLAHVRGYYAFEPRGELPHEKGVPDVMPSATFLFTGRLVPTPYQFLRRPRNDPRQQQQVQAQRAAAAAAMAAQAAAAARAAE